MDARPDILPVVEAEGIVLRRSGRQLSGLCPFHMEKSPSFFVDPEKGVFYCHACHEGGDAIRFVEKIHGVNFKEALKILGRDDDGSYRPDPERVRRRNEAREIAEWSRSRSIRLRDALLDIGDRAHVARKALRMPEADVELLRDELRSLADQWAILTALDDDLANPARAIEMFQRSKIEIDSLVGAL